MDHVVRKGILKNKMRWVAAIDPSAKTVSFQMITLGGSRMESPGKFGLAHLVEHCYLRGTTKHTAEELFREIYTLGSTMNASTSMDTSRFYCKVRSVHIEKVLALMSEILYESVFTEESIEKEKDVVITEINLRTNGPLSTLSMIILPQNAWFGTPAANPVGGNEADIRRLTRGDILEFIESVYRPENIVLSLSGDIPENIDSILEYYFSYDVKSRRQKPVPLSTTIYQNKPQNYFSKNGGQDALIAMAFPYATTSLCKYIPVIDYIVVDTMNSRLFNELRTKRGLIYSIDSLSSELRDVSLFGFAYTTQNTNYHVDTCLNTTIRVLNDLMKNGITEGELTQAKSFLVENKLLALEDTMTLADYYGEQLLLKGTMIPYEDTINEIWNLTSGEIQQAMLQLFTMNHLNLAVIT